LYRWEDEASMSWSIRIGEIAGITVRLHLLFILLIVFLPFLAGGVGTFGAWLWMAAFYAALFLFVLLHEVGHSIVARAYGGKVRDIVLLPIGGVARMERIPESPAEEIAISIAGPAVNLFFAALLGVLMAATGQGHRLLHFGIPGTDLGAGLFWMNLFMAGFNLIPAFPMDGGRVLRALIATQVPFVQATRMAARIGQGLAVLFGVVGLFINPVLVAIAIFIFLGAGSEANAVMLRGLMRGVPASQVMARRFVVLHPDHQIGYALSLLYDAHQDDFPVLEEGRLAGMLTRSALVEASRRGDGPLPVSSAMATEFASAAPEEPLADVYERMASLGATSIPVLSDGQLVGLVSMTNIARYLALTSQLRSR
jgi:Zn-dependent protease/CBS domain-containing protein